MFFLAVKLPIVPLRTWLPNHALTYLFFYELDLCNNYINAHLLDEIQNESPIYNKGNKLQSHHILVLRKFALRECVPRSVGICLNIFVGHFSKLFSCLHILSLDLQLLARELSFSKIEECFPFSKMIHKIALNTASFFFSFFYLNDMMKKRTKYSIFNKMYFMFMYY